MPDEILNEATVSRLAELGAEATKPELITINTKDLGDETLPPAVVMLWDRKLQSLISVADEVDAWRTTPRRRYGTAAATSLASFCDLIQRHKTDDSVVFGDLNWRAPSFTAVIDYHPIRDIADKPEANWLGHRIRYAFPMSEEWKEWIGGDAKVMEQSDFAFMVEDRIQHFVTPNDTEQAAYGEMLQTKLATPSELMMLARGLQVNIKGVVKETRVIQSGESEVTFTEEHMDASGAKLKVPGAFMIEIPTFYGNDAVRVLVRLRYRTSNGKILWFYQIYRPDKLIADDLADARATVEATCEIPFYEGSPE